MWRFDDRKVKIHLSMHPEVRYPALDGTGEWPFMMIERYFVKGAGKSRKGAYVTVPPEGEQDVVDALAHPTQWGLDQEPNRMFEKARKSVSYVVTGWIEHWFHMVKFQRKGKDSTWWEKVICDGRGCTMCNHELHKVPYKDGVKAVDISEKRVFGKRFHSTIARTHFDESFLKANTDIEANCKCGGFIYPEYFGCQKCEEVLIDMSLQCQSCEGDVVGIDPDQRVAVCQNKNCGEEWSLLIQDHAGIVKNLDNEIKCHNCGHTDTPVPKMVCTSCDDYDPYTLYDCQLTVHKTGEGKNSELHIDNVIIQEADERLFDPNFQNSYPDDDEEGPEKAQKAAEWNKSVFDLNDLYGHKSAGEQAAELDVENPFRTAGGGSSEQHKSYGRNRHQEKGDGDKTVEDDEDAA